jgi:hypothetical protein
VFPLPLRENTGKHRIEGNRNDENTFTINDLELLDGRFLDALAGEF